MNFVLAMIKEIVKKKLDINTDEQSSAPDNVAEGNEDASNEDASASNRVVTEAGKLRMFMYK